MAEILRMRSTVGQRCANKLEVVTDSEHLMHIDPNILLSRSEYEQNHVSKIRTTMENFASFVKGIKFMKNSEQISVLVSPVLTVSQLSNNCSGFVFCTWKRNLFLCKKEITVPNNSNFPAQQCQECTCFNGLHGLPLYVILVCLFVFFLLSIFIYFTVFRLSYWLLISNPVHNASGQYLFNLAKTLSLVPHKKKCQVKKPKYKKVGGQAAEDQKQIRTSSW